MNSIIKKIPDFLKLNTVSCIAAITAALIMIGAYAWFSYSVSDQPNPKLVAQYIEMPVSDVISELEKLNPKKAINYAIAIGSGHIRRGNLKFAEDCFLWAYDLSTRQNLKCGDILYALVIISEQKNAHLECLFYIEKTIEAAKAEENKDLLSTSLFRLGMLANGIGDLPKSLKVFEEYLALDGIDEIAKAKAWLAIGDAKCRTGHVAEANEIAIKYIDFFKQKKIEIGLADAYRLLGNVKAANFDMPQAITTLLTAMDFYSKANDFYGQGQCDLNIASVYRDNSEYPFAIEFFNKALYCFTKIGFTDGIGNIQLELGRTFYLQNEYAQAQAALMQAKTLIEQSDSKLNLVKVLVCLGDVKLKLNHKFEAMDLYNEAAKLCENLGLESERDQMYIKVSDLAQSQ